MFKEKFIKLKENFQNTENKNNKKTIENLVVFVIILIVTIVIINYVWNNDKNTNKSTNTDTSKTKTLAVENITSDNYQSDDLSTNIQNILSKIKGVGEVKVLITYSKTSEIVPMYSEDSSEKTTQENDSGGGTRVINENTSKKDIVYEENNGVKTPVTQSTVNPTIEGAIITAKGASDAEVKKNIIQAVEAATGLSTYKIQVFEMN